MTGLFVAVAGWLPFAPPAAACSCSVVNPRQQLVSSDAAFVGRLLSRTFGADGDTDGSTYRFAVDEAYKGSLGPEIEVVAPTDGAACGIEAGTGVPIGLFVTTDASGRHRSGLCSQVSADAMRDAVAPLPPATARGPSAFVVAAALGDVQAVAVDGNGATAGYVAGTMPIAALGACPGGSRFASVETDGGMAAAPPVLVVREANGLRIVRQVPIEGLRPEADRFWLVSDVACLSASGDQVAVVAQSNGDAPVVVRVRGDGGVDVATQQQVAGSLVAVDGPAGVAAASVPAQPVIRTADLSSGARLATINVPSLGRQIQHMVFVPGTRRLVFTAGDTDGRAAWLAVADVVTGRVIRSVWIGDAGFVDVVAAADGRVVTVPQAATTEVTVATYDVALQEVGRIRSWQARSAVVAGSEVFGVGPTGEVRRAPFGGGTARTVSRLPTTAVGPLVPLAVTAPSTGAAVETPRRPGRSAAPALTTATTVARPALTVPVVPTSTSIPASRLTLAPVTSSGQRPLNGPLTAFALVLSVLVAVPTVVSARRTLAGVHRLERT